MLVLRGVFCAVLFGSVALWAQEPRMGFLKSSEDAENQGIERELVLKPFRLQPENEVPSFELADYSFSHLEFETASAQTTTPTTSRPKAIVYSKGYDTRRKIHKYASIATLPLFVAEGIVGQKLFDRTVTQSDSLRGVHSGLAASIGVLFGVNTLTGIWNLEETRTAPHYKRRLVHGILMGAADLGFVVTAALAPHRERNTGIISDTSKASAHRAAAFTSFGIATVGYVYMLVSR